MPDKCMVYLQIRDRNAALLAQISLSMDLSYCGLSISKNKKSKNNASCRF
jgi:hypothetical protein